MLPKLSRLNLKKDFKWVASGKKLDSKYIRIFLKEGENKIARLGIASSTKTFKKATQRNRARRLTSSAFEKLYLQLLPTINIVALPKAGIIDVKSQDVLSDLEQTLKNANVIN